MQVMVTDLLFDWPLVPSAVQLTYTSPVELWPGFSVYGIVCEVPDFKVVFCGLVVLPSERCQM